MNKSLIININTINLPFYIVTIMLKRIHRGITDYRIEGSLASKLVGERIILLKQLMSDLPKPLKIIDLGGTEIFWEKMGFAGDEDYDITIVNLWEEEVHYDNLEALAGDARSLENFQDKEFDIVFSNSVIEHVGQFEDQKKMADEVQRLANHYFIQTPSYYTPVEPHYFFPLYQFFPLCLKIFLLQHFTLGYMKKTPDKEKAKETINSIRLLKEDEIEELFPDAVVSKEKLSGFTISFIVYKW